MRVRLLYIFFLSVCASGCGDDGNSVAADARLEGFDTPELVCPGSPDCMNGDSGRLFVGAAARVFTPEIPETWTDTNGDSEWQTDEPYDDANGNGEFDAVWLFGGARPANGVMSDLEARAMVFREGDTTVAVVYVDCLGMFGVGGDLEQIENDPEISQAGIDLVIAGSIHAHDAVDTLGLWGASPFSTGYSAAYNERVRAAAIDALVEAAQNMSEAEGIIAAVPVIDVPGDDSQGTDEWEHDIRDPVIFDPTMTVARFVRADNGETIGTFVNWADHPEMSAFGENNLLISSHFVHHLRVGIEDGVPSLPAGGADIPGVGGVTVFAQGALGGQIGSFRTDVAIPGPDGTPITESGHPKEEALGKNLARVALNLLASDGEAFTELPVSFRTARIAARLDNIGLQTAYLIEILAPHAAVGYDPEGQITADNTPWLPLRIAYAQVGPLGMVTTPGELHPELWVGGYDCVSWSWGYDCLDETRPNAPNMDEAPEGPYMRDLVLDNPGVQFPVLLGLAMDFIGYIVPAYNYVLDDSSPYLSEAEGHHYEETYSMGPDIERHVIHPTLELLQYRAP